MAGNPDLLLPYYLTSCRIRNRQAFKKAKMRFIDFILQTWRKGEGDKSVFSHFRLMCEASSCMMRLCLPADENLPNQLGKVGN